VLRTARASLTLSRSRISTASSRSCVKHNLLSCLKTANQSRRGNCSCTFPSKVACQLRCRQKI
jgi:hypothetical protein